MTRANIALYRAILCKVLGISEVQASLFGTSSMRHFLPNVARASGEPPEVRREIGRWAGSLAKDLIPVDPLTDHIMEPIRRGIAHLPDRYAQEAAPAIICAIIKRQVDKCSNVIKVVLILWNCLEDGNFS